MKPAPFEYHRPATLEEALAVLAEVAPKDGRVLAGGQSLVPMMAYRISAPSHLVDIGRIAELSRLTVEAGRLVVGANVRHVDIERGAIPGPTGALMRKVAAHVAHPPIRARGCFCGSLAHADPASEWCLVAVALGATLLARSVNAVREIPAADFFLGMMATSLGAEEILVEARLPLLADDAVWSFHEFARRAGDFALASILVAGRLVDGSIRAPRLAVGGAEAAPRRIADAEKILEGRTPEPPLLEQAANAAAEAIEPLEDSLTPAEYRRDLVRALAGRALCEAFS